ncbi:MAG: ABC transporter ATP-binding protein [Saezia sp.]
MFRFFENLVDVYFNAAPKPPPKKIMPFLWQATQGIRPFLFLMVLLSGFIGAFEAFLFSMLGRLVDWLTDITPQNFWAQEGNALMVLFGIILASIVVVGLAALLKYQTMAGNFPMRLRWAFHRLILNQSMGFFQEEFSGRVSAKVMQTALAARDVCMILGDVIVFIVIYFATMIAIVGGFHPLFLVPFSAWLVLYSVSLIWFVPRLSKTAQAQADARSLMTGRITDAYTNITTVKLFSHAGREAEYAKEAMQEFMQTVYKQMRLVSGIQVINHTLSMLLIVSTVGVALMLWQQSIVGVGAIAAASAMALRLNGMAQWIMWEMSQLFEQIGTVQDGINTLSKEPTVVDAPDATPLQISHGELRFENVCFSYNNDLDTAVLKELNFTIKPGERIGLIGRSGAGKSTVVNLLLRFYDIDSGQIFIDGQDISKVTQDSLRSQIGMVTQDTSLLHRSVRENIKYGHPDASDEDMIAAAQKAQADDFIHTLVDKNGATGYDVQVGERGVKLSGGQRQRIAIARVILKDAPILLLDEATSALDSEVEHAIQSNLYTLMEGKTVVAIAHRLSTIAAMDRLIVMDQGHIVEEGSHAELLEKSGLYAHLWAHQSGGFLPE